MVAKATSTGRSGEQYWSLLVSSTGQNGDQYWSNFVGCEVCRVTTSGDAVIEVFERGEAGEVSGAKKWRWVAGKLPSRSCARASKRPLSTGKKEKWGIL